MAAEAPRPKLKPGQGADVGVVLEGTYPYVSGGVSSWVHQIIRGLPELTFALLFIGGEASQYPKMRFELPPNVVHLEEHYLAEASRRREAKSIPGDAQFLRDSERIHDGLRDPQRRLDAEALAGVVRSLEADPRAVQDDFLHSRLAWQRIRERYSAFCSDLSFLEYFWTVRSMHAPLFMLARAAKTFPRVRTFHTISTGFAGFLGMLLAERSGRPLILTEHGIYSKERRIELLQADWLKDESVSHGAAPDEVSYTRNLWIRFFEGLGTLTYHAANPIIALYEGNRERQVKDGADRARTDVIPNGIDLARFTPLRAKRPTEIPMVLGLLGRVVPIKDIKTFIRTMRIVCTALPAAEGWLIGPEDEDKSYARECHDLVASLGLEGRVKFLGFQKPDDILPKLGLMMLTSISEAQPLVLLEGFASGLPCVSSDVGCCRDLVYGATDEDKGLGAAGRVTPIANPEASARAAIELLRDPDAWHAAQRAGIARVEQFYTLGMMIDRYRAVYGEAVARPERRR